MTHGYADDKAALIKRLHRIEGQVRGIERMVEEDRYCIDILTQMSAVTTALESLAFRILDDHVQHCVAGALASGDAAEAEKKARSCSPPSTASPEPASKRFARSSLAAFPLPGDITRSDSVPESDHHRTLSKGSKGERLWR